jgi:lysosomal alpha-mannosidase
LNDDSFVSSRKYLTFNADVKTKNLTQYINEMAAGYRGNHLLIPFGGDFTFENARMNFENMDRLI